MEPIRDSRRAAPGSAVPAGRSIASCLAAIWLVGGCAWHEPSRVEEDFGNSVRQMVQEQIYDKEAAARPPLAGPDLLDGTTADITVDSYRSTARGAREFRQQQPGNPVPVTGKAGETESESSD